MKQAIRAYIRNTDMLYLLLCALLSGLSIVTLFSVAQYGGIGYEGRFGDFKPAYTQILAAALGLVGALVVSLFAHQTLLRLWPLHAAVCWGLVLLTFIPGIGYAPGGTGSQSWIGLPLGLSFQPAEIAKISFILTFAAHLSHARPTLNRPKTLFPVLLHAALPVVLIHFQGDDGAALSFLAIALVMLVMAGLNRWVVAACTAAALAAAPFVWARVLSPHQRERILGLLNPTAWADTIMYQQLCARDAVAGGGVLGKGLFQPVHSYVPRAENDFIFSYFAECCGFIGCLVLLALLFGVIFKTLRAAAGAHSYTGAYICVGVFATLLFQCVINLGMNLMLLPVMGLTLPFVSAGGTSTLVLYLMAGLVMGVARQTAAARQPRGQLT